MKLLMFCVFVLSVGSAVATSCIKENVEVTVITEVEMIEASLGDNVEIPCDYHLSIDEDLPVTITWSSGYGLLESSPIVQCSGSTTSQPCTDVHYYDDGYIGRVAEAKLPIFSFNVAAGDTNNYWCNVTLEDAINVELGMDMKGVGLAVDEGAEEANFVELGENVDKNAGMSATLQCQCSVNSTTCDDVAWYKGHWQAELEPVITRKVFTEASTDITAYGDWVDRVMLTGNSLIINNLVESDSGRYWCEVKSAEYRDNGPLATDIASLTLTVDTFTCSKGDGMFADPKDCTKYYVCEKGIKYHVPCPENTIFSTALNYCEKE